MMFLFYYLNFLKILNHVFLFMEKLIDKFVVWGIIYNIIVEFLLNLINFLLH